MAEEASPWPMVNEISDDSCSPGKTEAAGIRPKPGDLGRLTNLVYHLHIGNRIGKANGRRLAC